MARKQLGNAPSDSTDAATVAYVQANKGTGGGAGTGNVYIQQGNPNMTSPGEWWQIDGSGNLVTLWIETATSSPYPIWASAVSNRATARARWVAIGDSITEGQGASARGNRWIDKAQDTLRTNRATSGNIGRGFIPGYYAINSWSTSDYGTTAGSLSNLDYVPGLGYRVKQLSQGASMVVNFTGTDIDLTYTSANGGTFSYAIDGGSTTNVVQGGSYRADGLVQITGLSAAAHTLTITSVSNTNYFNGIIVYNGDRAKGIQMLDSGHFGFYANSIVGDSGGFTAFQQMMTLIAADMITVMFGSNEYMNGTSVSNFTTQYTTLINALKGLSKTPNIMMIVPYQPADSAGGTRVDTWANYVAAIKSVATNTGVGILDLNAQMPKADTSGSGYYNVDGVHPNDSGHTFIANAVVTAMGV